MRKQINLQADNLLQGISEQVPAMRTLNHQNDRLNLLPSPIYGNVRRPQSYTLAQMSGSTAATSGFHRYIRDESERYLIVSDASRLRVYSLIDGEEITVAAPDGWGYLACTGIPRRKHRFLTAGDFTFVANRDVTVLMDTATTPVATNDWLIYCKQGDYATTYKVDVNSVTRASVTTGDNDVSNTSTEWIIGQISTQLTANLPAGFSHTVEGSVIRLFKTDGSEFRATVSDTLGNTSIVAVNKAIQRFEDLPPRAPNGFLVKVSGDSRSEYDDYFVRFVADDPFSIDSAGVWQETISPGIRFRLNASTMPHVLVREADGTFTFRRGTWDDRKAGGNLSSPEPSFVGKKIENLFFFADRLGFLHGSTMTTTATRQYFNFWRKTARALLETDPIDISSQTSEVLSFRYAFPFEENLVILADRGQLVARGSAKFTPQNAALTVTSHYEMDPESFPDVAGTSLFFSSTDGLGTALMELQVNEGNDRTDAVSISEHVPALLPNTPCMISASSSQRGLIVTPQDGPETVFMYSWLWAGRERVLSSWQKLRFGDDREGAKVLWCGLDNSIGYLVVALGTARVLLRMDMNDDGTWRESVSDLHLDFVSRPEDLVINYQTDQDRTIVAMPLPLQYPSVVKEGPGGPVGLDPNIIGVFGSTIILDGEHTDIFVGSIPSCYVEFSEPFPKKYGPRGEMVSNQTDRLQLSQIRVSYNDSGPFEIEVSRENRDPLISKSWGQRWDDAATVLGDMPVHSGAFSAPIKGSSTEVKVILRAQGFYPLNLISAEWTGIMLRKRK
jgi:hypothetical protein